MGRLVFAGLLYTIAAGFIILAAVSEQRPLVIEEDDRGERMVFAGLAFMFAIMGRLVQP